MDDSDDSFSVCLSELERCLHGVYVVLDSDIDPDSTDNVIIKCERLLVAILMLMDEGDSAASIFSDEVLNRHTVQQHRRNNCIINYRN